MGLVLVGSGPDSAMAHVGRGDLGAPRWAFDRFSAYGGVAGRVVDRTGLGLRSPGRARGLLG